MIASAEEHGSAALAPQLETILSSSWRELEKLQASLITASELQNIKSIIVFSGGIGEGCTTAAALMALGLEKDHRVLLADLDLNRPSLHELFNMDRNPGLTDAFDESRVPELLNAMRAVAETGKGPAEQTPSMGCSIKWRDAA